MEGIGQLEDFRSIKSNNQNAAILANIIVLKALIFVPPCIISVVCLCHLFMNIFVLFVRLSLYNL